MDSPDPAQVWPGEHRWRRDVIAAVIHLSGDQLVTERRLLLGELLRGHRGIQVTLRNVVFWLKQSDAVQADFDELLDTILRKLYPLAVDETPLQIAFNWVCFLFAQGFLAEQEHLRATRALAHLWPWAEGMKDPFMGGRIPSTGCDFPRIAEGGWGGTWAAEEAGAGIAFHPGFLGMLLEAASLRLDDAIEAWYEQGWLVTGAAPTERTIQVSIAGAPESAYVIRRDAFAALAHGRNG